MEEFSVDRRAKRERTDMQVMRVAHALPVSAYAVTDCIHPISLATRAPVTHDPESDCSFLLS